MLHSFYRKAFISNNVRPNRSIQAFLTFLWSLPVAIAVIGLTSTLVICTQGAAQQAEPKRFDLASDPDFRNYKRILTKFAHQNRPGTENDFCIEPIIMPDQRKAAWIVWKQGNAIIQWWGEKYVLGALEDTIDLKSDVVPTENDLHGSTYLVTRAWVANIISSCNRFGIKLHVNKSTTPKH